MAGKDIDKLVKLVAKLPSLGARSSRRIVLQLLQKRDTLFLPLIEALTDVANNVKTCEICGNFDTQSPCSICEDEKRKNGILCVVQDVADLWAMERVSFFKGKYHILGGILSALDGVTPEDLNIESMLARVTEEEISEVILALPATVDGQITAHYLTARLKDSNVKVSTLAQGIPMGAELDYMDEGTIQLAVNSRKVVGE
ncbi:MAG: recombination mediator RecR [Lactobacillus sp.]|jgi:recombination protein RecR|nr:recombination mediator RecR [Lactobacillus sp.]